MPERDAVCVHAGDLDREDRAVRGTAVRHTRRLGAAVVLVKLDRGRHTMQRHVDGGVLHRPASADVRLDLDACFGLVPNCVAHGDVRQPTLKTPAGLSLLKSRRAHGNWRLMGHCGCVCFLPRSCCRSSSHAPSRSTSLRSAHPPARATPRSSRCCRRRRPGGRC